MKMKIEKQSTKIIKPSVATPSTFRHYNISFIDELAPIINVNLVLFFPAINTNHNPKFVDMLENSLEKTLTRFYPLAGRYVEETHTVDCNDQGAEFIHAKVNVKLLDILGSTEINYKLVDELIPLESVAADLVTDPILAIQVTMFECGGVALGVSVSHRIVDAATLSTFLNEWAAMNRERNHDVKISDQPCFNSSSLFPGRGLHPIGIRFPRSVKVDDTFSKYVTKKFSFSERAISNLKAKAMLDGNDSIHQCSKVQLVSAIIWKALISVDRITNNSPRESILVQTINFRKRTASAIPKPYIGNIWGYFTTKSGFSETTEELTGILSDSIKKTINKFSKVSHDSEEGQMTILNSFLELPKFPNPANICALSSWCKFPFYEVDFGFGKPIWATCGSIPVKNLAYLMDDVGGKGVQAIVCMTVEEVPYFEQALEINTDNIPA